MTKKELANILAMTAGNVEFIITKIQSNKNKEFHGVSFVDELQEISNRIFKISQDILKTEKQNDKTND